VKSQHRKQGKLQVGAAAMGAGVLVAMGVVTAVGSGDAMNVTKPSTPTTTKADPTVTATTSEGEWAPMPEAPAEPTAVTATTSQGEWAPMPEVP
jgi:hypothetical protein